jgi:hypothetical protein
LLGAQRGSCFSARRRSRPCKAARLFVVERLEEVVLDPPGDPTQPAERLLAFRREADRLTPAVVRVALALDEPMLLELVQQPDELPRS